MNLIALSGATIGIICFFGIILYIMYEARK